MQKHTIALITDSTCDIPDELIQQYDIIVVPEVLIWGEETLHDRVDITPEAFYERLGHDTTLPTTTQPSPGDFEKVYRQAIADGAQKLVVITISSGLSGTYQTAKQVADQMDVPVHVVDSKGPTMSLGWQVLAAARARAEGATAEEMIARADAVRSKLVQIVCLDTLEYLHRGGRIGGAQRFIGGLLDIKPLVEIDHQTGLVEASGQARTRRKSIELLLERFFGGLDTTKPMHVAVMHGNAPDEAAALADRIRTTYAPVELLINITGPVLGVNTGPGTLALCGYTED